MMAMRALVAGLTAGLAAFFFAGSFTTCFLGVTLTSNCQQPRATKKATVRTKRTDNAILSLLFMRGFDAGTPAPSPAAGPCRSCCLQRRRPARCLFHGCGGPE